MSSKPRLNDATQLHELESLMDVVRMLCRMDHFSEREARILQRAVWEYRSVLINDYNLKL